MIRGGGGRNSPQMHYKAPVVTCELSHANKYCQEESRPKIYNWLVCNSCDITDGTCNEYITNHLSKYDITQPQSTQFDQRM